LVGRVIANGTTFPYVKILVPQTPFVEPILVNFGGNFCSCVSKSTGGVMDEKEYKKMRNEFSQILAT